MDKKHKYEFSMVNGDKFYITMKHSNIEAIIELIGNVHDGFFTKTDNGTYVRCRDIISIKEVD